MTVNVYTIVFNEEFMLPHFLKHYEGVADKIFVIDHNSTDKTAEIARAHPKVTYSKLEEPKYSEDLISRTFEKYAKDNPSDWAVCVDCDEFIQDIDHFFLLHYDTAPVLKTQGYMMVGSTGKLEDCKLIRMESFDKPVVFQPKANVRFGDGRHSAMPTPIDSDLMLYHYKYPSREYYLQRSLDTYPRIMDAEQMAYRIKRGLAWYDRHI